MNEIYTAENYSKMILQASRQYTEAKEIILNIMKTEYPLKTPVRVVHYHGQYTGEISGYDPGYRRMKVTNDKTGKGKWWHFTHIETLEV